MFYPPPSGWDSVADPFDPMGLDEWLVPPPALALGGQKRSKDSPRPPGSPVKERKMSKDSQDRIDSFDELPRFELQTSQPPSTPQMKPQLPHLRQAPSTPQMPLRLPAENVAMTPTPKNKKEIFASPPAGPVRPFARKASADDIEVALLARSLPLLTMALQRSHCCGEDHSVHECVNLANLKALHFILQSIPAVQADLHCRGQRPLHRAITKIMHKDDVGYKMLEVLLRNGAQANFCEGDDPDLGSPLHMAAERGCIASMSLLLAYGADPNFQNKEGHTPLHRCCLQLFHEDFIEEVAKLLISHGACPVITDLCGHEPASYVLELGLRQKLRKAAQLWSRQQLVLAVGKTGGASTVDGVQLLPEILEAITDWL